MSSEYSKNNQIYRMDAKTTNKWSKFDLLIALPIIFIITYFFSIEFSALYYSGDQVGYRTFYENSYRYSLSELPKFQNYTISAGEPVFGLIVWVGSTLEIDKNVYMSVFNAILCAEVFLLLRKYKVGYPFILISLTNYYLLVLLFSAERLKFGFIFLLAAGLLPRRIAWASLFISCLSHFQMILTISSIGIGSFVGSSSNIISSLNKRVYLSYPVIILGAYFIYREFNDAISVKAVTYYESYFSYIGAVEVAILFFIGLVIYNNKKEITGVMVPAILFVVIIGSARGNMIGVINWLWLMIKSNKTINLVVVAVMLYFSAKSYSFIVSVINFGHGFEG
jgi:hypothetical protein